MSPFCNTEWSNADLSAFGGNVTTYDSCSQDAKQDVVGLPPWLHEFLEEPCQINKSKSSATASKRGSFCNLGESKNTLSEILIIIVYVTIKGYVQFNFISLLMTAVCGEIESRKSCKSFVLSSLNAATLPCVC